MSKCQRVISNTYFLCVYIFLSYGGKTLRWSTILRLYFEKIWRAGARTEGGKRHLTTHD